MLLGSSATATLSVTLTSLPAVLVLNHKNQAITSIRVSTQRFGTIMDLDAAGAAACSNLGVGTIADSTDLVSRFQLGNINLSGVSGTIDIVLAGAPATAQQLYGNGLRYSTDSTPVVFNYTKVGYPANASAIVSDFSNLVITDTAATYAVTYSDGTTEAGLTYRDVVSMAQEFFPGSSFLDPSVGRGLIYNPGNIKQVQILGGSTVGTAYVVRIQ